MKNEKLVYSIGDIADQYISEAAEIGTRKGQRAAALRKTFLLAAAVAAALLLCGAAVYVISGGDLWRQVPSKDPEQVVREALEQQAGKDYTVSIQVESVAVDPEETVRAREEYISGTIAQWRGWSDEYLAEHFVAVKAVYRAEYDHTKTTRSDGGVAMYFYLVRDVDSGKWSIVDNSGNLNLAQSPRPEASASAPSAPPGIQEQIMAYLSDRYTRKYAQYYDGLRYEMSSYEETVEDGVCTATFLWTEYWLGKSWDTGADEGVEQMSNELLKITAEVDDGGMLDLNTILVYASDASTGRPDYVIVEEYSAPLPRIQWRKQVTEYLTGRYAEQFGHCDNLNCFMTYYEEHEENGVYTASFLWYADYPGGEGPGIDVYVLQVTAMVGDDGTLDMDTVSIIQEDRLAGLPDMYGPGLPTWQQKQVEAYLTDLFTRAYSPYYDGLHFAIRQEDYQETVEDGVYTATFLWTMYHLGKGWDVPSDEGVEQEMNIFLQVTAAVKDSGVLDLNTISVLMSTNVTGPMEYNTPVEELFPAPLITQ